MKSLLHNAWPLLIGMLLLMMANSLQSTLLGVRGAIESIDTATMGYVMSGYFAGFLGGSLVVPTMLRRVGHVRVYAALGSMLSVAFILFAAIVHPVAWIVLRFAVGFCFSGLYIVTDSWLNELSTNETRGQALSLNMVVQMVAAVLGQLLINTADPGGYTLFVVITVLVSISFLPVLLSMSPTPAFESSRPMSVRELVQVSPLACVGLLLLGVVFAMLYGMVAVYATAAGFSVADTAWLVIAVSLGAMVTQYPIGWLSDRVDRRYLLVTLTAIGTLAGFVGLFATLSFLPLFILLLVIGSIVVPAYSLLIAYANDHIEYSQMAAASGGLMLISGIGATVGPVLTGYAMVLFGNRGFFAVVVVFLALVTMYGVYRISVRTVIIEGELTTYHPLTSASSSAAVELAYGDDERGEANNPLGS